ncbi:MAG: hypothetical protein KC535_01820 [Nanoarchaeota archaeon]|nr:hypothetical protein [Nanoarchaeota archaeon]
MERKLVVLLVMGLLAISLGQTAFIYYTSVNLVSDSQVTAKATLQSGMVDICINSPPLFSFGCNTTLRQSDFYSCTLNASDADNDTLYFGVSTLSGGLNGSIDTGGTFSVTPTQAMVGSSVLEFQVSDASFCANGDAYLNVSFNVTDKNDPPVYDVPIASPISWLQDSSYRGLFLNDHFSDPDGDPLTYQYFSFSSGFTFTILGTSEVIITHSSCGTGSVIFQAKDPYNLTADSGVISLDVTCADENPPPNAGGGGGAFSSCESEWKCESEWSRCYINGTQKRSCTDIHGCEDPYTRYFWQECEYIAHCYNGVKDIDEEGIDCGGSDCEICETCYDDKLNNYEVEVDCGGPNCNACSNCFNGIQDYQETGLDCGGPSCEPCPTCNDGIQNQNETGLDCGGPFCAPCTRIEAPTLIEDGGGPEKIQIILLGSFLGLAILAVTYRLFKNQIHALIAALLLAAAMKKRKQILLSNEQKQFILSKLAELEKKDLLKKNKLSQFQNLLGRLQRQFFSFLIDSAADIPLIHERIDKLHTNNKVKELLKKQFISLMKLEKTKNLSLLELQLHLEFFRTIIFHLSRVERQEVSRTVSELTSYKEPVIDVIRQLLYNGVLALQFSKNTVAREKYMKALQLYQTLDQKEQAVVYDELALDFHHLAYASTFQ